MNKLGCRYFLKGIFKISGKLQSTRGLFISDCTGNRKLN